VHIRILWLSLLVQSETAIYGVHSAGDRPLLFQFPPDPSNTQNSVAQLLARRLDGCFEEEDVDAPAGQVFLCDTIIPYILSPLEEVHTTETIENTALIKICKFITVWPDLSKSPYKSKLDFLKSRVKLVKPGFRPSLDDLFPTPQAG